MRSLFGLLKKPSAAGGASLRASSPAEHRPAAGLITIDVEASAPGPVEEARLVVRGPGGLTFAKPLSLAAEPVSFWLGAHGQLLPDGPVRLELELQDGAGATLARQALTLQVHNKGELARKVAESLRRSGVPVFLDGLADSSFYDYDDPSVRPWFERSEGEALAHIDGLLSKGEIDAAEAEALRGFLRDGFTVLPDVVDEAHLARLNAALDAAVAEKHEGYEWGSSQRMHGLHEKHPAVRELWAHPKVLRMLGLIFGAPALPCQSLTYVFGSQQDHHQDTIHLTPFPAGYMCGVWTALEDVQPQSGELVVYPGSHRLKRIYTRTVDTPKVTDGDFGPLGDKVMPVWSEMIAQLGATPVTYQPKAGTVLIWHENLMHAGSPRADLSRSRRSVVCHYFADGAVAYYDSLGVPGVTHLPGQFGQG